METNETEFEIRFSILVSGVSDVFYLIDKSYVRLRLDKSRKIKWISYGERL